MNLRATSHSYYVIRCVRPGRVLGQTVVVGWPLVICTYEKEDAKNEKKIGHLLMQYPVPGLKKLETTV